MHIFMTDIVAIFVLVVEKLLV